MAIKVLPIFYYPFINTQHQVMHPAMWSQGSPATTLANSVYHQFNEVLGGYSASNRTDDELFGVSPSIKGNLTVGPLRMSVDLSIESFFEDLGAYVSFRWQSITMLYFFDDVKMFKWFYFVEDITQLTAGLWRFDLSLDMIKTYYQYIMAFKNVKPLRYFEKLTDYFNYDGTVALKAGNRMYMDPLLPYPSQATEKYPLAMHIQSKGYTTYYFTGLWDYYYMAFTSADTSDIRTVYRFRDNEYYIIAMPHKVDVQGIGEMYSDRVIFKELLDRSPNLLKKITSDIPPFGKNNYKSADITNMFYWFNNDEDNIQAGTRGYINMVAGKDRPYDWIHLDTYNGTSWVSFGPQSLQAELNAETRLPALDAVASDLGELQAMFIIDNNPNMYDKADVLQVLDYNGTRPSHIATTSNIPAISKPKGSSSYGNQKIYVTSNLIPYDVGYVNNVKLPIKLDMLSADSNSIYFRFTSYIIHDIVETMEVITPVGVSDEEYIVKRSNELSRTKVTDNYYEYVYLNQNALRQKEKQLNKYNDITTVLATVVGVGASVAGTVATGGAMAPVAIGAGVGAFNMVTNLFGNEMKRREHEAMLSDKKLQPMQFETGNYNASQRLLSYIPILSAYRFSRKSLYTDFVSFDGIIPQENPLTKVWTDLGHYTPTTILNTLSQAFTRAHYNYLQLQDTASIIKVNPIPNEHYRAILTILENGVKFSSISFIQDNTINNTEV